MTRPIQIPALLLIALAGTGTCVAQTTETSDLEAKLAEAQQRLEQAAKEVAELSTRLSGPLTRNLVIANEGLNRPVIGVQLDPESGTEGALVTHVSPGGPAASAGIRSGDVIVAVAGASMTGKANAAREVTGALRKAVPDKPVKIRVVRGGKAQELPNIDPVTRAILQGFLSRAAVKDLSNINVRSVASTLGLTVEEKRSSEPVTFNEWLHVQAFNGEEKLISAGGTFFGSPNNPRIVRLYSTPVEIPISGILLLLRNKDRPGIVGHLGTLLARYQVNIASMTLSRDHAGGQALTALVLDSIPPEDALAELRRDPDMTNVRVVRL